MLANRVRWLFVFSLICCAFAQFSVTDGRPPTTEERLKRHNVASNIPALVQALRNPNSEVRYLAAQKLAEDKVQDAIPEIVRALDSETVPATRINIAFALPSLGTIEDSWP